MPSAQEEAPVPQAANAGSLNDRLSAVQAELDQLRAQQQQQQVIKQQQEQLKELKAQQEQQQQQIQSLQNARNNAPAPAGQPETSAEASAAPPPRASGAGMTAYAPALGWWEPGDPVNPPGYDKWDDNASRERN